MIAIQNEREWARFAETVMQRPDLVSEERCTPNQARMENRVWLEGLMEDIFSYLIQADLQARLREADIAYSSVNEVADLVDHPALRRIDVATGTGIFSMPSPPVRNSTREDPTYGSPPAIGEHTDSIKQEFSC